LGILLVLYMVREHIKFSDALLVIALHSMVFAFRYWYIKKYEKEKSTLCDSKRIRWWLHLFTAGSLLAGVAWGLSIFLFNPLPLDYNLFIIVITIGLAAMGISTLGIVLQMYLFFMLPMLGIVVVWLILHNDNPIYSNALFLLTIIILYFALAVQRVSKQFQKTLQEESKVLFLKERIELALVGSNTSIIDWDLITNEFFISENGKKLLGYSEENFPNDINIWRKFVHPDDKEALLRSLEEHFKHKKEIYEHTHRLRHKDGHYIWILARASIFYNENGDATRFIGTRTDISSTKKIEEKLAEKNKILEESQRLAHIGSWKYHIDEDRLTWSQELYRIFNMQKEETLSYRLFREAIHPDDRERVEILFEQSIKEHTPYTVTYRILLQDNQVKYIKEKCETNYVEHKNISIGTVQDITEQKVLENRLQQQKDDLAYLAHHDTLTGLPNRVLFMDRLEYAIKKSKRSQRSFAVLFLDLDHFKAINDSLGHNVGDEVLCQVSSRFSNILRQDDTLARLSGDEFTIIMNDLKEEEHASILALKIIDSLSTPITANGHTLYISCSIGISIYPTDGLIAQDLLKYADAAMYKAKDEGRNNFQFYSAEMTEHALERVSLETKLRNAITTNQFEVYFQPQVNGAENRLVGMEALVRWNHPTDGLISPAKFIPLAESTGLIIKLDYFVMKSAMQQFKVWYDKGLSPGTLSLNLSVKQLQQKDFFDILQRLLDETGCRAEWLELEITESEIMKNPEEAITILVKINELGIGLAIDDFGTGYSSLSYLKRLPVNKLKIDQSFVRDLPEDEEDAAITKAIIALGQSLNLKVIAEGVETEEQKEFLVTQKCLNIQGYYYSKPVRAQQIEEFLAKEKGYFCS